MVKNTKFAFCSILIALVALVALAGCSGPSGEKGPNDGPNNGTEAELLTLNIGNYKVANIADTAVSGEDWEAETFKITEMAAVEQKMVASLMTNTTVTTTASEGAMVKFAFEQTEAKPASFNTNNKFTLTSGSYLYVQVTSGDTTSAQNYYRVRIYANNGDARLQSMKIAKVLVDLKAPGKTAAEAEAGSVTIKGIFTGDTITNPSILLEKDSTANVSYAVSATAPEDSAYAPSLSSLASGTLWVKVVPADQTSVLYYKITVKVENSTEGYGEADNEWTTDTYNADKRIFPDAPTPYGILDYDEYFAANKAPPSHWNTKGHNHKYPDLFHFANGNKVKNIADWENRQKEISAILQYYMHGRMPSIDPDVLQISYSDTTAATTINLTHKASGRTATITVNHTSPAGVSPNSKKGILFFGVGGAPNAQRHPGWGLAAFSTEWGGSESNRSGLCATLYGLNTNAANTPSVNMEYAWAMSVILTVIEEGGLRGYYDPEKIGIYGFSRWGKAAMLIGAFAESRGGHKIGFTMVGSAGSGGPAIDRWINQMGYKNHTEDPLPVDASVAPGGVNSFNDLKGIEWFTLKPVADDHNASTASQVVRGWTSTTPGIPDDALIYDEYTTGASNFIRNPGPGYDNPTERNSWGRIQVLSQARSEVRGWFSEGFQSLTALHSGANLDQSSGGVCCTMPFDAHYIAALIAPRIIYYEDGYNTMRNNPEGQWANWLMNDEVYQMYAEELNDPSIIWRNAIRMYDIEHQHQTYQDQDEYDLVTAIYAGQTPNAKFRTPPFPADDPRYRWDFDRMDWGRPGHPTIAERVRLMRESNVKVKAVDTRGLLDEPEALEP